MLLEISKRLIYQTLVSDSLLLLLRTWNAPQGFVILEIRPGARAGQREQTLTVSAEIWGWPRIKSCPVGQLRAEQSAAPDCLQRPLRSASGGG